MARANTAVATANYTPKWVKAFDWNGFEVGQRVKVDREMGDFTFVEAHIQDGEAIAIGVRGGTKGNETLRFFTADRISKIDEKGKRSRKVKSKPAPVEPEVEVDEADAEADEQAIRDFIEVE